MNQFNMNLYHLNQFYLNQINMNQFHMNLFCLNQLNMNLFHLICLFTFRQGDTALSTLCFYHHCGSEILAVVLEISVRPLNN